MVSISTVKISLILSVVLLLFIILTYAIFTIIHGWWGWTPDFKPIPPLSTPPTRKASSASLLKSPRVLSKALEYIRDKRLNPDDISDEVFADIARKVDKKDFRASTSSVKRKENERTPTITPLSAYIKRSPKRNLKAKDLNSKEIKQIIDDYVNLYPKEKDDDEKILRENAIKKYRDDERKQHNERMQIKQKLNDDYKRYRKNKEAAIKRQMNKRAQRQRNKNQRNSQLSRRRQSKTDQQAQKKKNQKAKTAKDKKKLKDKQDKEEKAKKAAEIQKKKEERKKNKNKGQPQPPPQIKDMTEEEKRQQVEAEWKNNVKIAEMGGYVRGGPINFAKGLAIGRQMLAEKELAAAKKEFENQGNKKKKPKIQGNKRNKRGSRARG